MTRPTPYNGRFYISARVELIRVAEEAERE